MRIRGKGGRRKRELEEERIKKEWKKGSKEGQVEGAQTSWDTGQEGSFHKSDGTISQGGHW